MLRYDESKDWDGRGDLMDHITRNYSDMLYRVALQITRNEADAKDAIQNCMFGVYRALESFTYQGEIPLRAWLYRCVQRAALGVVKKPRLRHSVELSEVEGELIDKSVNPLDAAVALELEEIIGQLLGKLSENQRVALSLGCLQGLGNEEVAERLGSSYSSVGVWKSRARKSLLDLLRQRHPEILQAYGLE